MSYCETIYRIIPRHSYRILRKCAGCGVKMPYESTDCFRVNANGRLLDVWLIYQCPKCRHTYNLPIYERVKPESLDAEEYQKFLKNDAELAMEYGMSKSILGKGKAEIDYEHMEYDILKVEAAGDDLSESCMDEKQSGGDPQTAVQTPQKFASNQIRIENPYEIKIRLERVLAEITGISRSRIRKEMKAGGIVVNTPSDVPGKMISVEIHSEI